MRDQLRKLPKVQRLLESPQAAGLIEKYGRDSVATEIRATLDSARSQIIADEASAHLDVSDYTVFEAISSKLEAANTSSLQCAINATGVIIHTNLGRARLAPEAIDAMRAVAEGYSTLELELETGKRGSRQSHVEQMICKLTGAEAAMVVNNCAAAIMTCLCALGAGREVIASRGEMVEIGGSFRMPDVIAQSGAHLKEVGTTNKTHLSDYAGAISDETAILLKSHTSNYAVIGFTSTPTRQELSALARDSGKILVEDLGSGVLVDLSPYCLPNEPVVSDVLRSGVDLVTFSGDKLLGGPQAGLIAGRRALIDEIKTHPMARAVRIDKLSLAALRATLGLYLPPSNPIERVPVLQMLAEPANAVRARAEQLVSQLEGVAKLSFEIVATTARGGAGSLPLQDLPSFAVALDSAHLKADEIASQLRAAETPVLGRISKDRFLVDMRAVAHDEIADLARAVNGLSMT